MNQNTVKKIFQSLVPVIIFITFIFILIPSSIYAESLIAGYFITSPHVIVEPGSEKLAGGASVEFFEKYIAPEMGITVVWAQSASSIPRQLKQLEDHEIDVGLVFAKNEERAKILNYPENPFFISHPTLAFLKDHPIDKIEKTEDILDLIIGYGGKAYISPFMRDPRIKFDIITTPDWMDVNLRKLLGRRNHAMYQPERSSFLYYIKKQRLEDKIKLISLPETAGLYTTFSKKVDKSLVERYDRAFEKVNGRELYIKILSKYLDINKL